MFRPRAVQGGLDMVHGGPRLGGEAARPVGRAILEGDLGAPYVRRIPVCVAPRPNHVTHGSSQGWSSRADWTWGWSIRRGSGHGRSKGRITAGRVQKLVCMGRPVRLDQFDEFDQIGSVSQGKERYAEFVSGSSELNLLHLPFFRHGKDPLEDFDYNDPRCNPLSTTSSRKNS
ncbi:hypothetical protein F511_33871 [Dorcoceras hygrometricum]|uniref:Uncharacterized protein n=1 Tax=Dorcoceras hygrometricum TaxID=472368 RepID=A0A2Z7B990_9LAMI|nr:hypothetical protein F511_33871 [Dorcoceras hygrometricum]